MIAPKPLAAAFKDFDLLPDGRRFAFWDCATVFGKTWFVDGSNPEADDANPGTVHKPFRTIGQAAGIAKAGEKVIIRAGIYRETVNPANGGRSAQEMVSFEAAPGEQVVISGAEIWQADWQPSIGYRQTAAADELDLFSLDDTVYYSPNTAARVWRGRLPRHFFIGSNPFAMMNASSLGFVPTADSLPHLASPKMIVHMNPEPMLLRQGLLFCDGQPLRQVLRPHELWLADGTYWVEEDGLAIHFRLPGDRSPKDCLLEVTTRAQGFVPDFRGAGYIRLRSLRFEKFANPFIPPQKGAISTNCGHHWIIEGCQVSWTNSVGIDIGFLSHFVLQDGIRGGHIIRRNRIEHCGVCGICGLPTRGRYLESVLIEDNCLQGNCWQDIELMWESAAIKNHYTKDCLYRRNIILDTVFGAGIWLDKCINNSRVCGNVLINCRSTLYGLIFIEATYDPVVVDHNLIWGVSCHVAPDGTRSGGHGVYEHEVDNLTIVNNLVFAAEGAGIHCAYTPPGSARLIRGRRGTFNRNGNILENLIHDCGHWIDLPTADNTCDRNLFGAATGTAATLNILADQEKHNLESWRQVRGFDRASRQIELAAKIDPQDLALDLTFTGTSGKKHLDLNLHRPEDLIIFWKDLRLMLD